MRQGAERRSIRLTRSSLRLDRGTGMSASTQMEMRANVNVQSWARGTYLYENLDTNVWRGEDDWMLTVNADGSRTMRMSSLVQETGVMRDIIYRVQDSFRPLELAVSTWKDGVHTGTGIYIVQGDRLRAIFSSPHGVLTQEAVVPEYFAMIPHSMATDGWYFWGYDLGAGGVQELTLVNPHAYGSVNGSTLAQLHRGVPVECCGEEEIVVPAGRFATTRWRITRGNTYDIWVTGANRTMVKLVDNNLSWAYYLSSFESSDGVSTPPKQ